MAGVGSLWVELKARAAEFSKEMKAAKSSIEDVTGALAEVGKVAGIAGAALAGVGVLAVKAASDFEQTGSLVDRVFGKASGGVKAFARTTSDELGVSLQEVTQGVTALGAQLKNTLGDPTAARVQAEAMTVLAADISAAMNIPFAESLERLQSGLRGETEAIEKLNIFIGESSLKQEAMRLGIGKSVEKMNEQEKVALRLAAIHRQTADLTGAAAAEAGTFAGQLSRLDAGVKNLAIDFGRELLPAATEVLKGLNGLLKAVRDLSPDTKALIARGGALAAVFLLLVAGTAGVAVAVASAAVGFSALFAALSGPAVATFVGAMAPVVGTVIAVMAAVAALILVIGALKYAWDHAGSEAQASMKELATSIGKVFGGVFDFIVDMAEKAMSLPLKVLGVVAKAFGAWMSLLAKGLSKIPGMGEDAKSLGDMGFDLEGWADTALDFQVDLRESFAFGAFVLEETAKEAGTLIGDGLSGALEGLASFVTGAKDTIGKAAGDNGKGGGVDLPGDGTKKDKSPRFLNLKLGTEMESGFDKLLDMIHDARVAGGEWAASMASTAPSVTDAGNVIAGKLREAAEAAAKSGTAGAGLAGVLDELRAGYAGALVDATQQAIASNGSTAAFAELRKQCERLGISFDDLKKKFKETDFDRTGVDDGGGIANGVARGSFNALRGGFGAEQQGVAKSLAQELGSAVSGVLSGGFDVGALGGTIGAALGSVLPGVGTAIGKEVGTAVANMAGMIAGAFAASAAIIAGVVGDFIASDPRLAAAGEAAAAAAEPMMQMALVAAALLAVFGPMVVVVGLIATALSPFLLAIGSLVAVVVGISGFLSALAVIIATLIAVVVALVVGFLLVVTGVGAFLAAVIMATAGLLGFLPVYAALFAGIGKLVMETEGAKRAMAVVGLVVDKVVRSLEPFGTRLMALAGLFIAVTAVIQPFLNAFAQSDGVALLLFTVLKTAAVVLGYFVIAVMEVGSVIFKVIDALATAMSAILTWLMPVLEGAGMGDAAKTLVENLDAAAAAAKDMGGSVSIQTMKDALDELAATTMEGATALGRAEERAEAIRKAKEAAREKARQAAEDRANDGPSPLDQLAEGVFNAVADFKVEAYRFGAMDAQARQGGAGSGGAGGTVGGPQYQGPIGGRVVRIDSLNLYSDDPRDFLDRLEKVADTRNFEQTGTKAKAGRSRPYGR